MFITSYIQIACFESYAERLVHKLRQNYLKAILRQQIQWFDKQQTGNLTARLTEYVGVSSLQGVINCHMNTTIGRCRKFRKLRLQTMKPHSSETCSLL